MDDNFACLIFAEQVRAGVNYSRLNDRSCLFPHFVSVNKVKTYSFANYFLYTVFLLSEFVLFLCEINENMKLNYRSPTRHAGDSFNLLITSLIRDTSNSCFL